MSSSPRNTYAEAAARWFGRRFEDLDKSVRRAVSLASDRRVIAADPNRRLDAQATFGERMADRVARFGGSWTFITIFAVALVGWTVLNTELLGKTAFDPYPYVFLNLILSMLAAVQAPIIMMSQNRQAEKDRQMASFDYEVNVKAEVEIMSLHEKMNAIRNEQLMTLLAQQQAQLDLLTRLMMERTRDADARPARDDIEGES